MDIAAMERELKEIVEQFKDYDESLLYSGLTILSKDIAEYLASSAYPGEDKRLFLEVYTDALNVERYLSEYGPLVLQSLETAQLPRGFARAAAEGRFDLAPLADRSIEHEWLMFPGKELFEKFKVKFKETICGKDGPYEKFVNGLVGQDDLPIKIASAVLMTGFSMATFWFPLAVYFSLLLIKAGLKTYCEE
jgi:hypothetical protein